MARTPWFFTDPDTLNPIYLETNPYSDPGSAGITKNPIYENAAGDGGKTLIFAGNRPAYDVSFDGRIYTEAEYNVFMTEMARPRSTLTDDRGVELDIVWKKFELTRAWTQKRPWRHEYSLAGLVLDYTLP